MESFFTVPASERHATNNWECLVVWVHHSFFPLFSGNPNEAHLKNKAQDIVQEPQASGLSGNVHQCRCWATGQSPA